MYHTLVALGEECRHVPRSGGSQRLREVVLGRLERAKEDNQFPVQPPRALWEIRRVLGREDVLISDVGLHKLWIGRIDRKSTRLNSSHANISYAVFCLKKKTKCVRRPH